MNKHDQKMFKKRICFSNYWMERFHFWSNYNKITAKNGWTLIMTIQECLYSRFSHAPPGNVLKNVYIESSLCFCCCCFCVKSGNRAVFGALIESVWRASRRLNPITINNVKVSRCCLNSLSLSSLVREPECVTWLFRRDVVGK